MKNLFKLGAIAFAITLSAAACKSNTNKNESTTDSLAEHIDSASESNADAFRNQADTIDSVGDAKVDSLKDRDDK